MKTLSFFSGAMGLDIGLEKLGFEILLACEKDKICRQTILANHPEIGLIGDIWNYTPNQIRRYARLNDDDEIDLIIGGPPCQTFSTAGSRRGFMDERGNALLRYVDLILQMAPKFAVIENVRGLLSAPIEHIPHSLRPHNWTPSLKERTGGALLHVIEILQNAGYGVSFNLYNSANYGVAQCRERVIIICSRDGCALPHLMPTHSAISSFGLPPWRTLKDALKDMDNSQCDDAEFPQSRLRFYRLLSAGQNWKNLPPKLQKMALGKAYESGGGKTGFLRWLSWDKPSCTLVTSPTMPATDICHPEEDRPLSVQEYARVQQFPDDWKFCGSIKERYKQIGNAVPVGLGKAVGKVILNHINGTRLSPPSDFPFSRYKNTDHLSWLETKSMRD